MSRELTMEALEILIEELNNRLKEMIREYYKDWNKPEEPKPVSLNKLWNSIPGEYKYIAKDKSNEWWGYKQYPDLSIDSSCWKQACAGSVIIKLEPDLCKFANKIMGDESWENSLMVRPCSEKCDIYQFQVGDNVYKFWLERPFPDRMFLYCQRNRGEHRKIVEINTLVEGSLFFGANGIGTRINQ